MVRYAVSRLGRTGQMALPKELQEQLGLEPGDYVALRSVAGSILLSRATIAPEATAEDILRQVTVCIGRAGERKGIREQEDLDTIADEVQQALYEKRYGGR